MAAEAPSCPEWLDAEGRAEWRRVVRQLKAAGLVARADRAMLAAYCEAWSEFVACVRLLRGAAAAPEPGDGKAAQGGEAKKPPHPLTYFQLTRVKRAAAERLVRLADRFGFSPAARARLVGGGDPGGAPADPKARFFNAG